MNPIDKLTEIFRHFPGIGPRQAQRFVYHLLNRPAGESEELVRLIQEVRKSVRQCEECFRYFPADSSRNSQTKICTICSDSRRDQTVLMVVSRDVDLDAIERSHLYHGRYFVLGGSVPILEKEPDKRIRLNELLRRIETMSKTGLSEIILSLSATPEGDHTGEFLRSTLRDRVASISSKNIKMSSLGRGLSTGSELEYADSDTIRSALANRQD